MDQIELDNQILKDYKIIGNSEHTTVILRYHTVDIFNSKQKAVYRPSVVHKSPSQTQRDQSRVNGDNHSVDSGDLNRVSGLYNRSMGGEFESQEQGLFGLCKFKEEITQDIDMPEFNKESNLDMGIEAQCELETMDIGVQCGTSVLVSVEVDCQTDFVVNKVEAGTQCEAIQTRSIKVGYKPESRTCKIQTEKKTMASIGLGFKTEVASVESQTVLNTLKSVDVAVECLQAPLAKGRHSQTFLETRSTGIGAHPRMVNASTSTHFNNPVGDVSFKALKHSTPKPTDRHDKTGSRSINDSGVDRSLEFVQKCSPQVQSDSCRLSSGRKSECIDFSEGYCGDGPDGDKYAHNADRNKRVLRIMKQIDNIFKS